MRKLKCKAYLNQPNLTRQKLWTYAEHLAKAHGKHLPREIKLWHMTCSELSEKKAYEEVEFLANQVEQSYGGRLA